MRNTDIQTYFLPGEKLLWQGRPKQGFMASKKDLLLVPFSLMWGGFTAFWEVTVIRQGNAPIFFKLWGVPFVLIGLYLIVGRFVVDAFVRARTQYAVTDQRIIILREGWFAKVLTVSLDRLPALDLDQNGNGTGTINFGTDTEIGFLASRMCATYSISSCVPNPREYRSSQREEGDAEVPCIKDGCCISFSTLRF